jgi:hypothetical protein
MFRIRTPLIALTSSLLLILFLTSARAQLYVNRTGGNDANDCLSPATPCFTVQGAVDKTSPAGSWSAIQVACGIYPEPINIYYFRTIELIGADQTCVFLRAETAQSIAWVQDHATAIFGSLTFLCDNGGVAVASRQYTIIDIANVTMDG